MPPKKNRKKRSSSKKSRRFPLFRILTLASIAIVSALTLLLILKLPEQPRRPPTATSSAPKPTARPRPATPTVSNKPIQYEVKRDDFETKVIAVDLAILLALEKIGASDSSMRHKAVETRFYKDQEYHYQNLTVALPQEIFPFLAELKKSLNTLAPTAKIRSLDETPRDLEISVLGQPTHHLFFPLTPTPPDEDTHVTPRPSSTGPRMAIIIDDLGESTAVGNRLARLPFPVTFSVLPYNTKAREVARIARQYGLELFLHLPCEPEGYPQTADSGPGTLRTSMSEAQLERTLMENFAQLPEVDGVNNHMGSKLTKNQRAMRVVLTHLKGRGKFFVDSMTTPKSCVQSVSNSLGMPYYRRNIFLDNTQNVHAILLQLKKAESFARKHGSAILIGHPYPATLSALEAWATKRDQAITLCPAGAI